MGKALSRRRVPRFASSSTALLVALLAALAVALLPAIPASAGVDDFEFESFDARYELTMADDGRVTAHVAETIVARFPDIDQNKGIIRAIPLKQGDVVLGVQVLGVADEHGAPVYWEERYEGGFVELWIDDDAYKHGRTTYVVDYLVHDPIRSFGGGADEFYWDVNGDGWAQPFDSVTATVVLDDRLAAALTGEAACYQGGYGGIDRCPIARDGAVLTAASDGPLGAYETVTVAIGFAAGVVTPGFDPGRHWIATIWPWAVAIAVGALLALAIVLRLTRWRDPARRRAIVAQYAPPEGAELRSEADVIGRRDRIVPATLVSAAVAGGVRILDLDPEGTGRSDDPRRYAVEVVDVGRLGETERDLVFELFPDGAEPGRRVLPGEVSTAIGAALYRFMTGARAEALRRGLRAKATGGWSRTLRWSVWIVFATMLVPWIWAAAFDLEPAVLPGVLAFACCLLTLAVTIPPVLLTPAGADLRDHLLGLREYLALAEEDRLRVLQSPAGAERAQAVDPADPAAVVRLYERLLPYAVLWGVERDWAAVLGRAYAAAAEAPAMPVFAFADFSRTAQSQVRPLVSSSSGGSSWGSSGGSSSWGGSSGGGFAGGGGGGGGGGGR